MNITDLEIPSQDDMLTPIHSIPSEIQSSNVSGSKGRFSECIGTPVKQNLDKQDQEESPVNKPSPKRTLSNYTLNKRKSEANKEKFERQLSQVESEELFGRLDKELEKRAGLKKTENKKSVQLKEDVVTRLLKYGENAKRKNEERIRIKKENEEKEISMMMKSKCSSLYNSFCEVEERRSSIGNGKLSSNSPNKVISRIQRIVKNNND